MTDPAVQRDYEDARQAMIDGQLRPEGIVEPAVLAAMGSIPRERFVPEEQRAIAYSDRAIPLGEGRAMSPPVSLGRLLEAIRPVRGERVLIVGAGTGYSAAVLGAMGLDVAALESSARLADVARSAAIDVRTGVLEDGVADGAPYDIILIDGAVGEIPDALVAQLADGGRLGAGLIENGVTRLVVGRKSGNAFGVRPVGDAAVPPLPGFERPVAFIF